MIYGTDNQLMIKFKKNFIKGCTLGFCKTSFMVFNDQTPNSDKNG